jgi:hypothetical protein
MAKNLYGDRKWGQKGAEVKIFTTQLNSLSNLHEVSRSIILYYYYNYYTYYNYYIYQKSFTLNQTHS